MDVGVFLSVVKLVGDDLLPVTVGEKVDGACRNNANQRRTEPLEQRVRGLVAVDVTVSKKKRGQRGKSKSRGDKGKGERAYRRIWPVSTKFHSRPPERCGRVATPPPTIPTETCFSLNRLDWRRVLTTSNGLVTMAPHIPPRLHSGA